LRHKDDEVVVHRSYERNRNPILTEEDIMFCPVCWKKYPKGFLKCDACNVALAEGEPEGHEHHHDTKPSQEQPKPGEGKTDKK
jgi:hypothetical protein